jgi:hypothetical protein
MFLFTRLPLCTKNWRMFIFEVINIQLLTWFGLFLNPKKHLKGRRFLSTEDASPAADGWFAPQWNKFFSFHVHFLIPSLCGLSTFKTFYSVLNTCHFLKSSKPLHVLAGIGHSQVLKIV